MDFRLNRELKAYCPDFAPIRRLLETDGASFVEIKAQVDHYYHLPDASAGAGKARLKLRIEKGRGELIYYRERQESGARTSEFQTWDTEDPRLGEILEAALGTRATIRKRRELWRKDNVIFNLDVVEGVGQILEVEVQRAAGRDIDLQVSEYHRLFQPFLGGYIIGSNEDLVAGINSRP